MSSRPRSRRLSRAAVVAITALAVLPVATVSAQARHAPPGAPNCGPTVYKSDGTPWVCTFDDEFTAPVLDTSKWSVITTAGNGVSGNDACMVNSARNVWVAGGYLNLTVRKESAPFFCKTPDGGFTTQYTGGQVATYGKFFQTYGRFAVDARFPASTLAGLQSSLWMWPENNILTGLTGEIDIAEEFSRWADRVIPTLHYPLDPLTVDLDTDTNTYTDYNCMVANVNAFHEYAVEWTSDTLTITIDGQDCLVDHLLPLGTSPFDQPFFLALTQALGTGDNGETDATAVPATTQIDWVRAWK